MADENEENKEELPKVAEEHLIKDADIQELKETVQKEEEQLEHIHQDEQKIERKLTRHEQKELERKKREDEHRKAELERVHKKQTKKIVTWFIIIVVLAGIGWWVVETIRNAEPPYMPAPGHYHALLDMEVCGKKVDLPRVPPGQGHFGTALLHTHDDNIVHVEGQAFKKEEIMLGRFMDAIGVPFAENQLFDKHNGDVCEEGGKPGKLKMFVNDKPNNDFRNYVILSTEDAQQQVIKLVFAPE